MSTVASVAHFSDTVRIVLAGLLWVAGPGMGLGAESPKLFFATALFFLILALMLAVARWRLQTNQALLFTSVGYEQRQRWLHLFASVLDAVALGLLTAASAGFASGLPLVLMVLVIIAALERPVKLALFGGAAASIALLAENFWRSFQHTAGAADSWWVAITAAAGMVGAALAARIGARLRSTEAALALERNLASEQQALNDRIVAELADGVIWVGADDRIRFASARIHDWFGRDLSNEPIAEALPLALAPGEVRWWFEQAHCLRLAAGARDPRGEWLVWVSNWQEAAKAFQRERLTALGLLVAGVAHEIRNPLAGIAQALDLLADAPEMERSKWLAVAQRNTQRIAKLVEEVLALGRLQLPQPQRVDLQLFWRQYLAQQPDETAARIALFSPSEPIAVIADRNQLRIIADNLIRNALAFASKRLAAIEVRLIARGDKAGFQIDDDGPGVAPELEAALFTPFAPGRRKGGTGLGLFLVEQLVRINAGSVSYERGPRNGATFTVLFPRAGEEPNPLAR